MLPIVNSTFLFSKLISVIKSELYPPLESLGMNGLRYETEG